MNELQKSFLEHFDFKEATPEAFMENMLQFEELMMMYNCAIREVKTKLEVLNDELSLSSKRNPIEYIQSRVKKPISIVTKLQRKGFEISLDSVLTHLSDVAGIRVICSFIDDIYHIAEMLERQDDLTVLRVKDYIKHPKPNGYRSYHMIVEIPVFFSQKKQPLRVEIQIRTMAMDFWASLEHKLKYKRDDPNTKLLVDELRECAEVIAQTDIKMMDLRNRIE